MGLRSLRIKLIVFWILCATGLITATNLVAFRTALEAQFEQLRQTLMAIAATGALQIDGEAHAQIPPQPTSTELPAYQTLVRQLLAIRQANPNIRYVYTVTPSNLPGQWYYIGDAEEFEISLPGELLDVTRYPAMAEGLRGASADPALTVDEWGVLLSGYAPIRNQDGVAVAVLGIDMTGEHVIRTQQALHHWLMTVLVIALAAAVVLGLLIAQWVTRPVRALMEGTQHIGEGHFDYRVPIQSRDEIGTLAQAFNRMVEMLATSRQHLQEHILSTIQSLSLALEAKDRYTRGHSERVHHYATKMAQEMRLPDEQVALIQKFSRLHDIGKIGVKEDILLKPAKLTQEEFEVIKRHPEVGYRILVPLRLPTEALQIVRYHHERLDGTGYPVGLQGDQIPLPVAIVSVADSFDAMTAHRPYRSEPMAFLRAIEELRQHVGTQFRADVVEALIRVLEQEGKLPARNTG